MTGDYTNVDHLSCATTFDQLFDWMDLKKSMALWLRASMYKKEKVLQIHWEKIRPLQHALTNLISLHDLTTSRDCILGMMAIRFFYLVIQGASYRDEALMNETALAIDWYYMVAKFKWSLLLKTGWAPIFFQSWALVGTDMHLPGCLLRPAELWMCLLGGDEEKHGTTAAFGCDSQEMEPAEAMAYWETLVKVLDSVSEEDAHRCPLAYAHVATVLAFSQVDEDTPDLSFSSNLLDAAQQMLRTISKPIGFSPQGDRRYQEKNNYTLANLMLSKWEFFKIGAELATRVDDKDGRSTIGSCGLLWCKEELTPNPRTCECEIVFTQDFRNSTFCLFVVDNRRRSSLRNITSILNARYWTLSYGINWAYAQDHGYEIDYVQPDPVLHYPDRKIGWAKVKVIHDALRERGPERCNFGEYHMEEGLRKDQQDFINGGFFIVRNSPKGLQILDDWYNVPETHEETC
eukprot:s311_g12.t1